MAGRRGDRNLRGSGDGASRTLSPDQEVEQEAPDGTDQQILDEAKYRFKRGRDWEGSCNKNADEDEKFANGDSDNGWQWPDNVKKDRDIRNRPCLTINKTKMHVLALANESRRNPPAAKVKPVGEEVSFKAAQVWEGIFRHIQYNSDAASVYIKAKENQLERGIGYWLVKPDWEDERSFNQDLWIQPLEARNTLLDCDIKRTDGSDAMWGFIFDEYDRKEFIKLFPGVPLPPARSPSVMDPDDWIRKDAVRVAQYYRIKLDKEKLVYLEDEEGNSWTGFESDIAEPWREQLEDYRTGNIGADYKEREVMKRTLQWFKIAGNSIYERRDGSSRANPNLKGKYIPIVRMVGRERVIDGKLYRAGLVRGLKDAQRMYNYNDLDLATPLATPSGWTTMGDVQVGDLVLSDQGVPTRVTATSPIFINRKCYRVSFDDGSSIIAGPEHLWGVEERGKRKAATWDWSSVVRKTEELEPKKHFIWAVKPLDLPTTDLPVDPYILGAWLGDGYSANASICAGLQDADAMEEVLRACRHQVGTRRRSGDTVTWTIHGISQHLRVLGLIGNKHIPAIYLRASREQREALLQGLMDTDGHASKYSRQNVFVTVSPVLAKGFAELVSSLGLKATFTKVAATMRKFPGGNISACQESYRFSFSSAPDRQIFRLPRKMLAHSPNRTYHPRRIDRHRIISIVEVPSRPTKCITVDAPSKLYLAGPSMVPTHNTSGEVEVVALQTKSPWIIAVEAVEGNEAAWANANTTNAAYLTFRSIADDGETPIPPPARAETPQPSAAFLEGLRIAAAEMEMASGQYQNQPTGQQNASPLIEKSPAAIYQRSRQSELANYDFTFNEMAAVRHTAVIVLDLAPHIYDTERIVKIMDEDGSISEINIDPNQEDAYHSVGSVQSGPEKAIKVLFNPKLGKYAVEASVGPSYQTQREAAWDAFVQIVSSSPELMNIFGDLGFLAADFPMADKIAERFRRHIEQTAPWLLQDSKTGPLVQQLTEQAQSLQAQLGEALEKLTEARMGKRQKEELRDIEAQDADNKRLTTVVDALKTLHDMGIDRHELLNLLRKTEHDMEHDIASLEVEKSNRAAIENKGAQAPSAA